MTHESHVSPRAPYENDRFREAQIDKLVTNYSFAGTDVYRRIRILRSRTFREPIQMAAINGEGVDVELMAGMWVIKLSPQRDEAFALRVVQGAARHASGIIATYRIDKLSIDLPEVTSMGQERFTRTDAYGMLAYENDIIKVHRDVQVYADPAVTDVIRSGDMGLERWREFSAVNKVSQAITRYEGGALPVADFSG